MLQQWRKNVLGSIDSKVMQFLNKVENTTLQRWSEWIPFDLLTFATLAWPEIIKTTAKGQVIPLTFGSQNGLVQFNATDDGNAILVTDYDVETFKNHLLLHFNS